MLSSSVAFPRASERVQARQGEVRRRLVQRVGAKVTQGCGATARSGVPVAFAVHALARTCTSLACLGVASLACLVHENVEQGVEQAQ
jgi:hypothetical protein